ncbi:cytochrome P450 [Amycolatopsis jiangsuensis]|uniref:Cytochrome P450 n=1 Tax=Amycolatopsis jiangsuensis TaxID=1181879 RepID=A0A840J4A6_9PSEU|nr:cytochrome P450 [Amycolatopsis jiangsuensis]MBB4688559.1 cytochrome P450 [Amycolatopsis jiangsuensis]
MDTGPMRADFETFAELFSQRWRADPYPRYRQWREHAPVAELRPGFFVVSGAAESAAVLRDPAWGHPDPEVLPPERQHPDEPVHEDGRVVRSFLGLNPPDHTRLRRLVSKAFTPRTVERLQPRIEAIAARLVSELLEAGEGDLMAGLAGPLPVEVIAELLGVPLADRTLFAGWSYAMARALDPDFLLPAEAVAEATRARREFVVYFRELAARRRRTPGADLLSDLVTVTDQGDQLTEGELLVTLTLLLVAGHETTTNLIGNGGYALLRGGQGFASLGDGGELAERAVEEVLRFDSPVQLTMRIARRPTTAGEFAAAEGSQVVVLLGAANRDPAVHPEPDVFDPARDPSRHLAFGQGIHFCLGAPLARLEGRVVFRELARRTPALRLSGTAEWNPTTTLRGLSRLPVSTS